MIMDIFALLRQESENISCNLNPSSVECPHMADRGVDGCKIPVESQLNLIKTNNRWYHHLSYKKCVNRFRKSYVTNSSRDYPELTPTSCHVNKLKKWHFSLIKLDRQITSNMKVHYGNIQKSPSFSNESVQKYFWVNFCYLDQ